ncbi:MAG: DivIVA domain-containing protein [candidate division Zixibacteria bacterium]
METTPNDLRQQQFEIKFRGYNPDDVEVFRDLAATALEEARAETLKLSEENNHLNERLKHLIDLEDTLKAVVVEAQKNADATITTAHKDAETTIEQAKKEAELIVREAEHKKSEVIADMHRQMGKLVADINKIRFIRSNYLTQLKSLITSQLASIEQLLAEDDKGNGYSEHDAGQGESVSGEETAQTQQYTAEDMQTNPEEGYIEQSDEDNNALEQIEKLDDTEHHTNEE